MKVLIILDGIGDNPCKALGGKTPLEAAKTPNLDKYSQKALLGQHKPSSKEGIPQSDSATLALLGNNPNISPRGWFEALGAGIKIERGDLALRANFATINNIKEGKIIDRRVGRTLSDSEAKKLAKVLNKKIKLPVKFVFRSTNEHRGVLVLRGAHSDNITDTDPEYHGKKRKKDVMKMSRAEDGEGLSEYTADLVNQFITQAHKILKEHQVNKRRKKRGLMQANIILTRGAGKETPKMKQYPKWAGIVYMPLEKGMAKASGMTVYSHRLRDYRGNELYEHLRNRLKNACRYAVKILKRKQHKHEGFYIHLKETDPPGHDGLPKMKKEMIEIIDSELIKHIRLLKKQPTEIMLTGDHATPSEKKAHTNDPVPIMLYRANWKGDEKRLGEKNCSRGRLGTMKTQEVMQKTNFA